MGQQHPQSTPTRSKCKTSRTATRICAGRFAGAVCAGLVALGATAEPRLEHVGTFVWERPEDYFGGWSAIEVRDGGEAFLAIGDSAQVFDGRFERTDGVITGVTWAPVGALAGVDEIEFFRKTANGMSDSEGVALVPGGYAVSFERQARVILYRDGRAPERIDLPREVHGMGQNGGVEALATDRDGRLIAIPETIPTGQAGFPVWRQTVDGWEALGVIAKTQGFLPVGADMGLQGRLFVLERAFRGVGFQSRIRVFDPEALTPQGTLLWAAPMLRFDNLEGLSVWQDAAGLRFTMISDDNHNWFQRTEIVEFRLTE